MKPWQKEASDSQWPANEQPVRTNDFILPTINWEAHVHLHNALFTTSFQYSTTR